MRSANQNLIIPAGTSKIGQFEYDVDLNSSPATVEAFNDFPIKVVNGAPVYIRDIGHVRDGFAPQTNIVRQDGGRAVLLTVMKAGQRLHAGGGGWRSQTAAGGGSHAAAGTEDSAAGAINRFSCALPSAGVIREAVIAACLTGPDDPAVPGQLAQHVDHRHFHSALDS